MGEWSTGISGPGANPVPQGSMTCKARHLPGQHGNVQPDNETKLKHWRALVGRAGRALDLPPGGLVGPVLVVATHTIARPRTVPLRVRAWPTVVTKGHGDVDKLGRALLDGLAAVGVFGNDAQVCGLHVWKRYPDSPGCAWIDPRDHLAAPGVVIRIRTIT